MNDIIRQIIWFYRQNCLTRCQVNNFRLLRLMESLNFSIKVKYKLAYAIGVTSPMTLDMDTFGTGKIQDKANKDIVLKFLNFSPGQRMMAFVFQELASYGHVGREHCCPLGKNKTRYSNQGFYRRSEWKIVRVIK